MNYLKTQYKQFESEINDIIKKCIFYNINKYDIDDDGLLKAYENVDFSYKHNLNEIPLKFKEVFGNFSISYTNIKSLFGSPIIVHNSYNADHTKIKNLKHCPNEVGNIFCCRSNTTLKHIYEFPKYVGDECDFIYCDIISLYGCPKIINCSFLIFSNINLKSLKYSPNRVDGDYNCGYCCLNSLYGAPKYVSGNFYCYNNRLTSLKHSPKYIGGDFYFENNKIKTFYDFPEFVGGRINCNNNPIYEIWSLFEDKNYIEYFNQLKIIKKDICVNVRKLNMFLNSIDKNTVKYVKGYVNV